MIIQRNLKFIKNGFLIVLGLILLNTLYIFNFYIVKKGDLDFFNLGDHIFGIVDSFLAFFATLLGWYISFQTQKLNRIRVLGAFLIAAVINMVLTSVFFGLTRVYNGLYVDWNQLIGNIVFGFSISFIPVSGITLAFLYFRNIQKLKLEKQSLQSQLLSKNLEPHFLFNNLSILSSLMRKDSQEAEIFLDNLSEVYRYFLKHNEADCVTLEKELEFLEQYIQLIVSRFGGVYQLQISVENKTGYVVPFVLHNCIENAVKHNKANEKDPLIIEIIRKGNQIMVKNPIRLQQNVESSGKGLINISRRYALLLGKHIQYSEKNGFFIVEIPIV
ncbi:hypothetical protein C9994_10385 [Marivirga lumbricoides]|uniref:Signal transduction histidine kinase internal region domain-containing protein n=1 Tax=Marivirga lumbricoides TaxID=1046115 RepID=A0A2T4DPJ6_9BACT|nr:hypothetical protein C9994_10385 [Marivirga lumbricoides]